MAPATDRLLLVFVGCAAFSGLFLLIATLSGALHSHPGHLGHPSQGTGVGHGHGTPASHGPQGGLRGGESGAHPGLQSGKVGAQLHSGKANLHLEAGKHGHHAHVAHTDHGPRAAKAGNSPRGDVRGREAGRRGPVSRLDQPSASVALPQRHLRWSGVASLLVSSLNVYGLLAFLFHMGVAGIMLSSYAQLAPLPRVLLSSLIGVAAALFWSAVLGRLFGDRSGLVTKENSQLEGREVRVTRTIRRGGTGEALFTPHGGVVQTIPARSMDGQSIPAGQSALVVTVHQGIALVERLDLVFDAGDGASAGTCDDNEPPS